MLRQPRRGSGGFLSRTLRKVGRDGGEAGEAGRLASATIASKTSA